MLCASTRGWKRARVERPEPSAGVLALTKWFVCFTVQSQSLSSTRSIISDFLEFFFGLFYSDFVITLAVSGSSLKGLQPFLKFYLSCKFLIETQHILITILEILGRSRWVLYYSTQWFMLRSWISFWEIDCAWPVPGLLLKLNLV
jgi:hypothetical protein